MDKQNALRDVGARRMLLIKWLPLAGWLFLLRVDLLCLLEQSRDPVEVLRDCLPDFGGRALAHVLRGLHNLSVNFEDGFHAGL